MDELVDQLQYQDRYTIYEGYYSGAVNRGKINGYCRTIYSDGTYFEGIYKDNKRNGFGTRQYINGDKYEGNWLNDKKDGKGSFFYADGRVETG